LGESYLRAITRLALTTILTAGLLNLSVMAAVGNPLGMVVNAENAHLGEANAAMGTNLFGGDSLQTDPGGTLRVRLGASQVYLGSASYATLFDERTVVRLKLDRGTIGFSSSASNRLEIATLVANIRPADGQAAFGEVTILNPTTILVAAYRGSLVVSNAGFERTVKEGDAFNVSLAQTQDDTDDNGGGSNRHHRSAVHNSEPIIFTAIVAGALAGLGFLVWHLADESDSAPPSH
jgi:hypothetical protein